MDNNLPMKTTLPIKGQTAAMPDFDSGKLILKWKNLPGINVDMDAMIFGIDANDAPVAIFSDLYKNSVKAEGPFQGRLDDFPYIELAEDDLGDSGEWGQEEITMAALIGHKELHIILYNYTAASKGQKANFKEIEARVQLILSHEGSIVKEYDIPVTETTPGIAVSISKITVTPEGNKIANETVVIETEDDFKKIPGSEVFTIKA